MHIFMAALAVLRRRLEGHVQHIDFKIGRLVTINAGHGPMRPDQRKACLVVIKLA